MNSPRERIRMPEQAPRVCVVGATNVDLIAKVSRIPAIGETLSGEAFHVDWGGKGSNQAVMAGRLGARVTMVSRVGRDVFGERAVRNYQDRGIDTTFVSWDAAKPSGVASILVDGEGRNAIVYVPGANFALTPDHVRAAGDAIAQADAVVSQLEIPPQTTEEALSRARHARRPVTILNPAPAGPISDALIRVCDVIVPNELEAAALTGVAVSTPEDAAAAARRLIARGARAAVITLGAAGAVVADGDGALHVAGLAVDVVDTTGAGDAFIGTLAYMLGGGAPLRVAARRANVAAALSVTKIGTQASFPSCAEVAAFAARLGDAG